MIEEYEILISEQIPHLSWLLSLYSSGWLLFLYIAIGCALTIYWNLDNDGMINSIILFGWFAWPVFLVLSIPEFLCVTRTNYVEKNRVCEWNENNKIGTCVRFTNKNEIPAFGKTITDAYIYSIVGACVDVRDDEKDGKYTQDYICHIRTLKLCDKEK